MKRELITGLSFMLAASLLLYACQKEVSPFKSASISASTTNAATGEKVTLTVANMPAGTHLMWGSTNMSAAAFSANGAGSANVSFSKPGTYTVSAYIVSGEGADSIPWYDTTHYPYDTAGHYPDTTVVPPYPHDTTVYNPGDTVPGYPHDTVPGYPHDTLPNYPHDTTTGYPHDTMPGYPHDTVPGGGWYDSTHHDSVNHPAGLHIIQVVTIVITVH